MADPATKRMTLDEFLWWDDGTETRYELVRGAEAALFLTSVDLRIAMSELYEGIAIPTVASESGIR